MNYDREQLKTDLRHREGVRHKPYQDGLNVWTVGVGHNMTNPISERAVCVILEDDIAQAERDLEQTIPTWKQADATRQRVMMHLSFALGLPNLRKFIKMRAAIRCENWNAAAVELLDSDWAREVGNGTGQRAHELAEMLRRGDAG